MSWQVATFAGLALVLLGGFAWYERARPPARLVALVAALAALAIAGRLALAPVPNVVATTDIALLTGYALGPGPGFVVGALAAPVSNIWLGQGPWTAWQMGGWGLAGLAGAWLALASGRRLGRLGLAAACGAAGLAYGALLDLSVMVTYGGEQSADRYLALSARGLPFNIAHALGNVAFALAAGPALVRMISRYRTRLQFRWHPAGALPLAMIAVLLVGSATLNPAAADAKRSTSPAVVSWLVQMQNADGGYGASLDFDSSPAMTGWTMMGLEAAGVNPLDVRTDGRTPVSYLRAQAGRLRSTNDLERTILALEGAGIDSRSFEGVDLVAELRSRRAGDGSIANQVNLTAFYALALRAAGVEPSALARTSRWLREAQNRDGGWGFNPGAPSDPDSTGAALQALAATGSGGSSTEAGARWLRRVQSGGGGWGLATTGVVNAQSTAWAVQALVAVGDESASLRDGIAYLERLRAADGHYRYSAASDQTPVWVTAQVLLAIEREPLPLQAVPRSPRPQRQPAPQETSGGGGSSAAATPGEPRPSGPDAGDDEDGRRAARNDGEKERRAETGSPSSGDGPDPPAPLARSGWTAYAAPAEPTAPVVGSVSATTGRTTRLAIGGALLGLGAGLFWVCRRRRGAQTTR